MNNILQISCQVQDLYIVNNKVLLTFKLNTVTYLMMSSCITFKYIDVSITTIEKVHNMSHIMTT